MMPPATSRGTGALGPIARAVRSTLTALDGTHVTRRVWAADHTLWSERPDEIANRLGWLEIDAEMAAVAGDLEEFARGVIAEGYRSAVLLGMGGASLAAEVLAVTRPRGRRGLRLRVVATTDPSAIRHVTARLDRERTLFIVASKSGTTIETRALLDYFWELVADGHDFIAITDAGSPLDRLACERKFRRVFALTAAGGPLRGEANIGGRYSALSSFGLVPAALAGVPLDALLSGTRAMRAQCAPAVAAADHPGAWLGAVLGAAAHAGRDKLTLLVPDALAPLGRWIEQLIAESTGKDGRGILPVVGEPLGPPSAYGNDRLFVAIGDAGGHRRVRLERAGHPVVRLPAVPPAALGAEFYRWEFASAVASHILGVHPFNQPNVQEAKEATEEALGRIDLPRETPRASDVLASLRAGDYLSLQAYAHETPRLRAALQAARARLRDEHRVATTVGFGPALLHAAGQLHKGGPDTGAFLLYVSANRRDLAIPGRPYTFGALKRAQALGELDRLRAHGRRVAWITRAELDALGRRPAVPPPRISSTSHHDRRSRMRRIAGSRRGSTQ